MSARNSQIIRKISLGSDLKNCMTYQIGSSVNSQKYTVTKIIFSDFDFAFFGDKVYQVFCTENGVEGVEFLWQAFENFENLRVEYVKAN